MEFIGRLGAASIAAFAFHLRRFWLEWLLTIAVLMSGAFSLYALLLAPPAGFPVGEIISVKQGEALPQIAETLAKERVIAHPLIFEAIVRVLGRGGEAQAGPYRFATPANTLTVAFRILNGVSGIPEVRLTIPEGATVREMAALVARKFPDISASDFIAIAGPYEGYLFPDTYQFAPSATPAQIVAALRENFATKVNMLSPLIQASGHSLSDIVIMASIVEREAKTPADKRTVAGILWHRIALGIPLQVDAVFGYIQDRAEYSPSFEDLSIDSPYNTYQHKGLPPGPIGNPGLEALQAAVGPTVTDYLYYLTGNDGLMHYAATFTEHKINRAKYLH